MSKLIKIDDNYAGWIKDLSLRFRQSQIKAAVKVNSEMLRFYFSLGADIVTKQAESKWGDGFFRNLSMDLQDALPGVKGFSIQSLYYAKKFYLLYTQPNTNFPQLGGKIENRTQYVDDLGYLFQIPWGHHKLIIDKCDNNIQKALFFVKHSAENNWSRAVLLNFLDTNLYERQVRAITNFKSTLPSIEDIERELKD